LFINPNPLGEKPTEWSIFFFKSDR